MALITWYPGTFRIMTQNGPEQAEGLVGGPFGLRQEPRRWRSVWTATHLMTGLRITLGNGAGFCDLALAQEFAERLLPLADWSTGSALRTSDAVAEQVIAIWNELIARDVAAANMTMMANYTLPVPGNCPDRRRKHAR